MRYPQQSSSLAQEFCSSGPRVWHTCPTAGFFYVGFFTIEWADDNSGTEQGSAGAPNFERLGEVFHIGCREGFATVTFLTGKRDSIYEIRIDDMRLHLSTFHIAGVRASWALSEPRRP